MKVLVTGGAGYVGSALTRALISRGDNVRVIDCGFFGLDHVDPKAEVIAGNILEFDPEWLDGVSAVVHLAGLSNDPMAAFSPSLNYILNAGGAAIVAQAAKDAGVRRFIFSSTCSVYGVDDTSTLNEDHPARPQFPYAISKLMAERLFACLTDDEFRPIVLRKGTVVGCSPRMRFDLVTNAMVKTAVTEGKIVIHNPDLWRPLIDIEDACGAYLRALDADLSVTGIFNISAHNFTLDELGEVVARGVRDFGIDVVVHREHRPDLRSYRVETNKAARVLKFVPKKPMSQTVKELVVVVMAKPKSELEHRRYYNIRQMQHLIAEGILQRTGHTNGGHVNGSAQAVVAVSAQ
jgi:nucleoside-diphosphate-sugar epimerase